MLKRTIEISGYNTRLSLRNRQVIVEKDGENVGQFPAEDVGMLIIDSPTAQYTHKTLISLIENGAIILLCGDSHLPEAFLTPCNANSIQTERLAAQVNVKLPVRKRLWQQLIKTKIKNQASNIDDDESSERLKSMADKVRSGDPNNVEAQAARFYWSVWLEDKPFRRQREGEPPNNLLNYGYTILRAAVARAIAGAGLHPSIGLHHHNRYDTFCLADDLMEPFRPLVDRHVREMFAYGLDMINKETKQELLSILLEPVGFRDSKGPLFVELEKMTASLVRCFTGESEKLEIPELV